MSLWSRALVTGLAASAAFVLSTPQAWAQG